MYCVCSHWTQIADDCDSQVYSLANIITFIISAVLLIIVQCMLTVQTLANDVGSEQVGPGWPFAN